MKFSIVTPTFNSEKFLEDAILSVITQSGDFSIEYIICDNCSTDRTEEIVNKYIELVEKNFFPIKCRDLKFIYVRGSDVSMYDAINKGFSRASGEIYAWINSDDIYLPGAFSLISTAMMRFPEINWLKGITSYINNKNFIWNIGKSWVYRRDWISKGLYGSELHYIQQDSVFWRSDLWKAVGGIDIKYRRAGDFYLWMNFAKVTSLFTVNSQVSCFRKVDGQLSQDVKAYQSEVSLMTAFDEKDLRRKIRLFRKMASSLPSFLCKHIYKVLFPLPTHSSVVLVDSKGELTLSSYSFSSTSASIE